MIKPKTPECDGCGITKDETNHWFVVCLDNDELCISNLTNDDIETPCDGDHHYCGEGCLINAMSKELERLK